MVTDSELIIIRSIIQIADIALIFIVVLHFYIGIRSVQIPVFVQFMVDGQLHTAFLLLFDIFGLIRIGRVIDHRPFNCISDVAVEGADIPFRCRRRLKIIPQRIDIAVLRFQILVAAIAVIPKISGIGIIQIIDRRHFEYLVPGEIGMAVLTEFFVDGCASARPAGKPLFRGLQQRR